MHYYVALLYIFRASDHKISREDKGGRGEAIFECWSATVGTCRTILTRRRFMSDVVLLDERMIFYAWMAKKKGAGGIIRGTSVLVALFF